MLDFDYISNIYLIISISIIAIIILFICIYKYINNINNNDNIDNRLNNIYNELEKRKLERDNNKKYKNDINFIIELKKKSPNITLNDAKIELINKNKGFNEKLLNDKEIIDLYDINP